MGAISTTAVSVDNDTSTTIGTLSGFNLGQLAVAVFTSAYRLV